MPDVGAIEYKYRRNYILVNPDPTLGPPTWRVASPQEVGTGYDFEGVLPAVINKIPDTASGLTTVETSIDFTELDDREE